MPKKDKISTIYNGSIYTIADGKDNESAFNKRKDTIQAMEAKAKNEIEALKIKAFKDLGKRCIKNVDMIETLTVLPITICAFDATEMKKLVWEIKARIKSGVLSPNEADKNKVEKYLEEKQRLFQSEIEPIREDIITQVMKEGEYRFVHLMQSEFVSRPYKVLLYSGLVWVWCNFEVIMKDLWESALNMAGKNVVKDTLKSVSQKKEGSNKILGKSISLDYLAKFNYNLSGRLGTALLSKFDFDSLSGLKEAYSATFPRSLTIKKVLESKTLCELEAKRNVIVHRAGFVDAEYCDKTNTNRREIGKELEISSMSIKELNVEVLDCVNNILKAVSSIVSSGSINRKMA